MTAPPHGEVWTLGGDATQRGLARDVDAVFNGDRNAVQESWRIGGRGAGFLPGAFRRRHNEGILSAGLRWSICWGCASTSSMGETSRARTRAAMRTRDRR